MAWQLKIKMKYIKDKNWKMLHDIFNRAQPFSHVVIDDFFTDEAIEGLVKEFPKSYNDPSWGAHYNKDRKSVV